MKNIGGLFFLLMILTPSAGGSEWIPDVILPALAEASDSCRDHLRQVHQGGDALREELEDFRRAAENALALREETIRFGRRLQEKVQKDIPLTGKDLDLLGQGISAHLTVRKELLGFAEAHECWLDLSEKELTEAGILPEVRLSGILLSLSAALVLYDNYLLGISLFEGDPKLRRLLNERDSAYAIRKAELAKTTLHFDSLINRHRIRRAVAFYEREMERRGRYDAREGDDDYLATLISQSPSYSMLKSYSPLHVLGRKLGFLGSLTIDAVSELEREGVNVFSMLFGNAVGLVETRKGKLYSHQRILSQLETRLRSGDILLEKTPFRLTDKLIPGYWGHAAIWIGTEEELKDLGVWDHPVVTLHHGSIREGNLVVEALRSGVEMNTLEDFLNVDSIGILRRSGLTREERAQAVVRTLRQVGKNYDFNFDVETKERIYCSKLVYFSYPAVDWSTGKSLGRTTFTPDDVAARALEGGELELITFFHEGDEVNENPLAAMAVMMAREAGQ